MITMKMIADKAGVSQPVVSQVLNGLGDVKKISKKTQERVLHIAEKLNYRRNALALSMKTGRSFVIGVLGNFTGSYSMEIIMGINDFALKNNYMIKLIPVVVKDEMKNALRLCVEQRLDGIICRSVSEQELDYLHKELKPYKMPVVLVDNSFRHSWCSRVISDDLNGAKQAVNYLLKLGHRNIMLVTNKLNRGFSKIRHDGFFAAMKEAGLFSDNKVCVIDHNLEMTENIRTAISAALRREKPTAVFCVSDPIAMKLIIICAELGLKIPENLSVIGYGGIDLSVITNPPLTTISQMFKEMGRKACEVLLSEIKDKSTKKDFELPVELIIRNSTAQLNTRKRKNERK